MNFMRHLCFTAAAALLLPTTAMAMPGQTVPAFHTWASHNPALRNMAQHTSEMSGQPYFSADFHIGDQSGTFSASVGGGHIVSESIGIDTGSDDYDMTKHHTMLESLLRTVYGKSIVDDFNAAKPMGRWTLHNDNVSTALFSGKLFTYEVAHSFVRILKASEAHAEAKRLAECVKMECGD